MPRILFLIFLLPLSLTAQRKINLTVFGGFSNYIGDLQEKRFTLDQAHAAFGVGLSYELIPKLSVQGALKAGKISADDKFSKKELIRNRNLNFESGIYEFALTLDYSLFDLYDKNWTPYVFAGGALLHYNPYAEGISLRLLSTEGQGFIEGRENYNLNILTIPFGGGVRVKITDNVYIGYEIGLRKVFSDYLDDVSKTYVDRGLLLQNRGQTAVDLSFRGDEIKPDAPYPVPGTVRGSPKFNDWYYFSGITLSIGIANETGKIFGKSSGRGRTDCPRSVL